MSTKSQNCETIRDSRCKGTALQTHPLLGNGSVAAKTYMHATTEELLEVVFSARPTPRLYNKDQLPI
jgi:hypothetical protein